MQVKDGKKKNFFQQHENHWNLDELGDVSAAQETFLASSTRRMRSPRRSLAWLGSSCVARETSRTINSQSKELPWLGSGTDRATCNPHQGQWLSQLTRPNQLSFQELMESNTDQTHTTHLHIRQNAQRHRLDRSDRYRPHGKCCTGALRPK